MADDLDDELLSLVESKDKEKEKDKEKDKDKDKEKEEKREKRDRGKTKQRKRRAKSISESDGSGSDVSVDSSGSESDFESKKKKGGKKGRPKKKPEKKSTKKPASKKRKAASDDEDSESDDDLSSDQDSAESGSGNDGEDGEDEDEDLDDGYGDDLMGDEKDRENLMKMSAFEREQILAERQNKRDAWREKQQVRKKLREQEREARRQKKPTESKSARSKRENSSSKDARSAQLRELKARKVSRDSKKAAQTQQLSPETQKKEEAKSDSDSESSGDESDKEESSHKSTSKKDAEPEKKEVLSLKDLNMARVSRVHMARWVHLPWFNDLIKGCFVRVGIGSMGGELVYRIAEVVGVEEYHRVYAIEKTLTKKALVLRQGKWSRTFRMEFCSNSTFTTQEFNKWMDLIKIAKETPPSLEAVQKKAKELEERKKHILTNQEVQIMLEEKKKLEGPRNPLMEKIDLEQRFKIATVEQNPEEIKRLEEEIKALEPYLEKMNKQKTERINIDKLNRRNQLEQMEFDFEYQHNSNSTSDNSNNDPFARRPCQPMPFSFVSLNKEQIAKMAEKKTKPSHKTNNVNQNATAVQGGEPKDVLSIHNDLDIDIDLEVAMPGNPTNSVSTNKPTGLYSSLSNFKKEKGVF